MHGTEENESRGSPCVSARPLVSGVDSGATVREGQWCEISGDGERESDWELSCDAQWNFWSLIGHLIFSIHQEDWDSDYQRDYLVPVGLPLLSAEPVSLCRWHPPFIYLPTSHGDLFLTSLPRQTQADVIDSYLNIKACTNIWESTRRLTARQPRIWVLSDVEINYGCCSKCNKPVSDTFAGIPFIAVCGDHLDRNLQATSELVYPLKLWDNMYKANTLAKFQCSYAAEQTAGYAIEKKYCRLFVFLPFLEAVLLVAQVDSKLLSQLLKGTPL